MTSFVHSLQTLGAGLNDPHMSVRHFLRLSRTFFGPPAINDLFSVLIKSLFFIFSVPSCLVERKVCALLFDHSLKCFISA